VSAADGLIGMTDKTQHADGKTYVKKGGGGWNLQQNLWRTVDGND
jgi:hypothetical protein